MGSLVETAEKNYDEFWATLKASDLTKVDMSAAMVTKTTLEIKIDQAKEKETAFETAASDALIAFDESAKTQLEAKREELATLESTLSIERTGIEVLWQTRRVAGNYDPEYVVIGKETTSL